MIGQLKKMKMKQILKMIFLLPLFISNVQADQPISHSQFNLLNCSHLVFETGYFNASQGSAEDVGIEGLNGDQFTLSSTGQQNVLLGLGYFIDGINQPKASLWYGIDAFYLAQTWVKGDIIQEQFWKNLSYQYNISNYPIYFDVKTLFNLDNNQYSLTMDMGIGPNIIVTNQFSEAAIVSDALPDLQSFSGNTSTAFSATVGLGVRFNHLLPKVPVEIGYRFFYLGDSSLKKENDLFSNTLHTGASYANALVASLILGE